jgi:hypothetical protein
MCDKQRNCELKVGNVRETTYRAWARLLVGTTGFIVATATLGCSTPLHQSGGSSGPTELIAFASSRGGNWDIYVMKADGSDVTKLTRSLKDETDPLPSPDGTKIAFVRDEASYVINVDGTRERRTGGPGYVYAATAWSPNSHQLVLSADEKTRIVDLQSGSSVALPNGCCEAPPCLVA